MGDDKKATSKVVEAESLQSKSKTTAESYENAKKGIIARSALVRRVGYKPSHRATFIGIMAVIGVLLVNAAIVVIVINTQNKSTTNNDAITIGPVDLDSLGMSRNTVGTEGTKLVVGPDATFSGKVTVADTVSISGQLRLNSDLTAASASFEKLQAGNTSLEQLGVNTDITATSVNVRQNLAVAGNTTLQGSVTIAQLLTINNSATIAGNLAVGGTLSINQLRATSLQADSSLTIGGHIRTQGAAPSVGPGGAVGSNGTVSISGNDAAGTVAVNVGSGAGGGVLANIGFRNNYTSTPHVIITPVGRSAATVFINRNPSGFSINTSAGLSPGGYVFDYIVVQ